MRDIQTNRFGLLGLALAAPMALAGCVTEWHEDGDGWHDLPPEGEECPSGYQWDPVLCECIWVGYPGGNNGEVDAGTAGGLDGGNNNNSNNNNNGGGGDGGTGGGGDGGTGDGGQCPDPMSAIYLSDDAATCGMVDFSCPDGFDRFVIDGCGCGCEEVAPPLDACPDETDPNVLFVSTDARVCTKVDFSCPDGQDTFHADCGCGCIAPAQPQCPDPNDPKVHYLSEDRAVCDAITFSCPDECVPFDDECGCGCIEP